MLFVFVIGSLIVAFLINPNSLNNLKDNINLKFYLSQPNITSIGGNGYCFLIEQIGLNKNSLCKSVCSENKLNYYDYSCDNSNQILVCNCIK